MDLHSSIARARAASARDALRHYLEQASRGTIPNIRGDCADEVDAIVGDIIEAAVHEIRGYIRMEAELKPGGRIPMDEPPGLTERDYREHHDRQADADALSS